MEKPYLEEIKNGYNYRTFSSNLNENELKWHWDGEDRIVICEHDTDWMIQIDNQLPSKIEKNTPIFIPNGEYHRLIKGVNNLVVKVKKLK
jgi:hypothetical protein